MDSNASDLTIICGWCSLLLHLGKGPVSHGICEPCHKSNFPDIPFQGPTSSGPVAAVQQ